MADSELWHLEDRRAHFVRVMQALTVPMPWSRKLPPWEIEEAVYREPPNTITVSKHKCPRGFTGLSGVRRGSDVDVLSLEWRVPSGRPLARQVMEGKSWRTAYFAFIHESPEEALEALLANDIIPTPPSGHRWACQPTYIHRQNAAFAPRSMTWMDVLAWAFVAKYDPLLREYGVVNLCAEGSMVGVAVPNFIKGSPSFLPALHRDLRSEPTDQWQSPFAQVKVDAGPLERVLLLDTFRLLRSIFGAMVKERVSPPAWLGDWKAEKTAEEFRAEVEAQAAREEAAKARRLSSISTPPQTLEPGDLVSMDANGNLVPTTTAEAIYRSRLMGMVSLAVEPKTTAPAKDMVVRFTDGAEVPPAHRGEWPRELKAVEDNQYRENATEDFPVLGVEVEAVGPAMVEEMSSPRVGPSPEPPRVYATFMAPEGVRRAEFSGKTALALVNAAERRSALSGSFPVTIRQTSRDPDVYSVLPLEKE